MFKDVEAEDLLALVLSKPPTNIDGLPDLVMDMLDQVMAAHQQSNLQQATLQLPDILFEPPVFPLFQLPPHLLDHVLKFIPLVHILFLFSFLFSFHIFPPPFKHLLPDLHMCALVQVCKKIYSHIGTLHFTFDGTKKSTPLYVYRPPFKNMYKRLYYRDKKCENLRNLRVLRNTKDFHLYIPKLSSLESLCILCFFLFIYFFFSFFN